MFRSDEAFALQMDAADPLRGYRDRFHLPTGPAGRLLIYFCGNSLGLQPKSVRADVERELDNWAQLGVEGHFKGNAPWYAYQELFRESGARLVGAEPGEVVMMNSLTVNLHLLMASFYRPTSERYKILADEPLFPSDRYALQSQLRHHGYDPEEGLLLWPPRPGEHTLRTEDLEAILDREGSRIALVLLSGVNFVTGQWLDMPRITLHAKRHGCVVGWDLAHAAGNLVLHLHDWQVDFAVWCSYKYLNCGPGAVAGCFVHGAHGRDIDLPRLAGWWGNDPATRFQMQSQRRFVPRADAFGWQVSNPPILAMTPLRASLALFDEVGMPALRAKSERLTGYLEFLLEQVPGNRFEVITPRNPRERGCQLSIAVRDRPRELVQALEREGVICDFREPNVIRAAPVPLYNSFHEVWEFAQVVARPFL
jgi:kynureninase